MPGARSALTLGAAALLALGACGDQDRTGELPARAPAPAAPEPDPEPDPDPTVHLTLNVSGDLLIHSPVFRRAQALAGGRGYDFSPMFRAVRPWIRSADLAFCHLETPLTAGAPTGYPRFGAPRELARALRVTGWDACSTASNHSLDRGQAGVDATRAALTRAGVRHTGTSSSRRGAQRILMLRSRGVKVALLAYTTSTNGLPRPHPWTVNLAEPRRILRDASRARRAGAQVVLVNLHWGTEYRHAPDAVQRHLARRLSRSPQITAVVGQHAHVVQPIRRMAGRWVVFGEGNLISNQTAACCPAATQDGMLVELHVRVRGGRAAVDRIRYVPTWVRHPDFTVLPVGRALRRGQGPAAELRASWARTVGVVGRSGGLEPVPRRLPRP